MKTLNNRAVELKNKEGEVRTNEHGVPLMGLGFVCKIITKADDLPSRTIRMVASNEAQDRMGDVILSEGWELEAYKKNPVILWGHNHSEPAIAKAVDTRIEDKQLIQDWHFPEKFGEVHELSELIYVGYMEDIFNASSVGFAPLKWRNDGFEDGEREELGLGEDGWLFIKQELYEVSAVNVPANPEALQLMKAKGLDTKPLEKMLETGTVIEIQDDVQENVIKETAKAWDDYLEEELSNTNTSIIISEDELTDHAITVLTNKGYQVIAPDEDILTLTEPELELEPEPEIDAEEVKEALAEAYQKRTRAKVKQLIRGQINHLLGIVEEHND